MNEQEYMAMLNGWRERAAAADAAVEREKQAVRTEFSNAVKLGQKKGAYLRAHRVFVRVRRGGDLKKIASAPLCMEAIAGLRS